MGADAAWLRTSPASLDSSRSPSAARTPAVLSTGPCCRPRSHVTKQYSATVYNFSVRMVTVFTAFVLPVFLLARPLSFSLLE